MIAKCLECDGIWEFTNDDVVIMEPFPHYECPDCEAWIPAF